MTAPALTLSREETRRRRKFDAPDGFTDPLLKGLSIGHMLAITKAQVDLPYGPKYLAQATFDRLLESAPGGVTGPSIEDWMVVERRSLVWSTPRGFRLTLMGQKAALALNRAVMQ